VQVYRRVEGGYADHKNWRIVPQSVTEDIGRWLVSLLQRTWAVAIKRRTNEDGTVDLYKAVW